jgi:hypothetical protein
MQIIDAAVEEWFAMHPDVKPEVKKKYRQVYAKCQDALNAANHALAGTEELTQEQYDAAFQSFKEAYLELRDLLHREGIAVNDKLGTGQSAMDLPEPMALSYRVQ